MDYLSILPDELLNIIFNNLNRKNLILISRVCKRLHSLISLTNIKFKDFPRKEGKAKIWTIPRYIVNDKNIKIDDATIMNYIYNLNIVRGDIVIYNWIRYGSGSDHQYLDDDPTGLDECHGFIFDGIYPMEFYRGTYLPLEFKIIENNVPTSYWNVDIDNLFENNVLFDFEPVFNQCIINIRYTLMSEFEDSKIYGIYTHFIYNDNKYYVVYDYYDGLCEDYYWDNNGFRLGEDMQTILINDFIKHLSEKDNMNITLESRTGIVRHRKNTLFIYY